MRRRPTPTLVVQGLEVQLLRKAMKNLRLVVSPPDGMVRVSVPHHVSDKQVRDMVLARLPWIKKQQAHFLAQPRPEALQMVTGDEISFLGKRYPLEVIPRHGRHEIIFAGGIMQLFVHQETTESNRTKVLQEWYRSYLKQRIPQLLAQWQPVLGVEIRDFGVKNMKTRWGSCNINRKRIWLGLQLAQRPAECLEYVVVHELLHLIEKQHNKRFYGLLDRYVPDWQQRRTLLYS